MKNYTEKQLELINWYTKRLEAVKSQYGDSLLHQDYITLAESDLEAVKNGREW